MKDYLVSKITVAGLISNEIDNIGVPRYVSNRNGGIVEGLNRACEIMLSTSVSKTHKISCKEIDVLAFWFSENTDCSYCPICNRCDYSNCLDCWKDALTEIATFGSLED